MHMKGLEGGTAGGSDAVMVVKQPPPEMPPYIPPSQIVYTLKPRKMGSWEWEKEKPAAKIDLPNESFNVTSGGKLTYVSINPHLVNESSILRDVCLIQQEIEAQPTIPDAVEPETQSASNTLSSPFQSSLGDADKSQWVDKPPPPIQEFIHKEAAQKEAAETKIEEPFAPQAGISASSSLPILTLLGGLTAIAGLFYSIFGKKEESYHGLRAVLREKNVQMYNEAKTIYENRGYTTKTGKKVVVDYQAMLDGTEMHADTRKLPVAQNLYETVITVKESDTLDALIAMKKTGANPVGINMANLKHAGGGFKGGDPAQEEHLCRHSTLFTALIQKLKYPWGQYAVVYNPHVKIYRDSTTHELLDDVIDVNILGVAAFNLKRNYDLKPLGLLGKDGNSILTDDADKNIEILRKNQLFMDGTKQKIRNWLRGAAMHGHTELVFGALGCGAFENPPKLIAEIIDGILKEPEFSEIKNRKRVGRFKEIVFAIKKISASDQNNLDAFRIRFEKPYETFLTEYDAMRLKLKEKINADKISTEQVKKFMGPAPSL